MNCVCYLSITNTDQWSCAIAVFCVNVTVLSRKNDEDANRRKLHYLNVGLLITPLTAHCVYLLISQRAIEYHQLRTSRRYSVNIAPTLGQLTKHVAMHMLSVSQLLTTCKIPGNIDIASNEQSTCVTRSFGGVTSYKWLSKLIKQNGLQVRP